MSQKNKSVVKIDFQILKLSDLIETTGNPQHMSPDVFAGIVKSLKKSGWILDAPVVWHRPDKKYQILSGHHRVRAAIEAGIIETGCKIISGIEKESALMKVIEANQRRGNFDDADLNSYVDMLVDEFDLDRDLVFDEIGIEQEKYDDFTFDTLDDDEPVKNKKQGDKKSPDKIESSDESIPEKSSDVRTFIICPHCGKEIEND